MFRKLAWILACGWLVSSIASPLSSAQCPVNSILIRGHVENAPRNPSVRVQLFYPPDPHKKHSPVTDAEEKPQAGESTEATLDGDRFSIPVEFLTNDRRTTMNFNPACSRKPNTVVITLKDEDDSQSGGKEFDRLSLDFPRDFKSDDSHHYTLRADVTLNGQP